MEYVNAEIATLPPQRNPRVTSAEFTRIRSTAMNQRVYSAREIQAGAWRGTGRYALVAGGPARVIPPPRAGQGASGTRLRSSFLGSNDRMVPYQGNGFVVSYPASWQKENSQSGSAAFAPPNGAGQAAIGYGVVIDGAKWQGGVRDASSLAQATHALAQELTEANGGFQQASQARLQSSNRDIDTERRFGSDDFQDVDVADDLVGFGDDGDAEAFAFG